ncbi:hypothetical protein GQ53DRAFT_750096 [Thozetella sp. PMI_491]|nr:hypothetical protein GQ53DRAFT_750096 [Thozetella sp. PMI_491]
MQRTGVVLYPYLFSPVLSGVCLRLGRDDDGDSDCRAEVCTAASTQPHLRSLVLWCSAKTVWNRRYPRPLSLHLQLDAEVRGSPDGRKESRAPTADNDP